MEWRTTIILVIELYSAEIIAQFLWPTILMMQQVTVSCPTRLRS